MVNKGEHGWRKLADTWESMPYIVVSKDHKCHIYRVRNTCTGQEKAVNRNLLLQANFLPLEIDDGTEPCCDNGSEISCEQSVDISRDAFVSESEMDSTDRTASWVAEAAVSDDPPQSLCIFPVT